MLVQIADTEPTPEGGPAKRLLSVAETATLLGVSNTAVRAYERKQMLPAVRLFGRVFFDKADLNRIIDEAKAERVA